MAQYTALSNHDIAWYSPRLKAIYAALLVFAVLCAVVGAALGDCDTGPPSFLYYVALAFVSVAVMAQICVFMGSATDTISRVSLLLAVGVGAFDVLDFFTDGQQVSLAVLCDDRIHPLLMESVKVSWFSFAAPFVDILNMSGIMIVFLILSIAAQLLFVWASSDPEGTLVVASFTGLGAFQKVLNVEGGDVIGPIRALSVGLFESLPGLYLQASLFSFTFDDTDDDVKSRQLLSIALSGASTCKLAVTTYLWSLRNRRERGPTPSDGFLSIFMLSVMAVTLVATLRLWFSYQCASHIWNVSTGYVNADG